MQHQSIKSRTLLESKKTPLVSVIIPTYNYAIFTTRAIESVLLQTYKNIEIIVIDDGSTDDTLEILKKFEGHIKWYQQDHAGVQAARNRGIRLARGEYIAFLDADDEWLPDKIEKQVLLFKESPHLGLVYTRIQFIDETGHPTPVVNHTCYRGRVFDALILHNCICVSSVMVPKKVFGELGFIDETLTVAGDWHMWLRIAQNYDIDYVDKVLANYRLHESNTHRDRSLMLEGKREALMKIFANTQQLKPTLKNQALGNLYLKEGMAFYYQRRLRQARQCFFQAIPYIWLRPFQLLTAIEYLFRSLLGKRLLNSISQEKALMRWKLS